MNSLYKPQGQFRCFHFIFKVLMVVFSCNLSDTIFYLFGLTKDRLLIRFQLFLAFGNGKWEIFLNVCRISCLKNSSEYGLCPVSVSYTVAKTSRFLISFEALSGTCLCLSWRRFIL